MPLVLFPLASRPEKGTYFASRPVLVHTSSRYRWIYPNQAIPQSGLIRKPAYLRSIMADSSELNGPWVLRESHALTDSKKKTRTSGACPPKLP